MALGTGVFGGCGSTDSADEDAADDDADDANDDMGDDTDDDAADDTDDDSEACSDDGSSDLVIGTYTRELENVDSFQFRMFRSDCQYCSGSVDLDDAGDDQDLDGEWSSEFLDDPDGEGQEIEVSAGGTTYTLSGSGLTLFLGGLGSETFWFKDTSPTSSCGGETVD